MRRILLLVLAGALAAMAILYGLRIAEKASNAAVTAFLPRETIVFAHLPDLNRMRDQWHQCDIYQLYRETAVQDFLRKPLARAPKKNSVSEMVQEFQELDPKDIFVALTSMANDAPKFAAGFRFAGSQDDAEPVISKWRSQLLGKAPAATRETVDYEQHKIDIFTGRPVTLSTVYDGHWFFASNDLTELKAVLDRADGRVTDRQSLLNTEKAFRAAMAKMPANYALCFYVQPKIFAEKIAALRGALGQQIAPDQRTMLEQIRSVCGTTRFENGKMHDVIFAGMPKFEEDSALTRESVAFGTKDTFFYVASLLNLSKQLGPLLDSTGTGNILGAGMQKLGNALSAAGITIEDWKAAFGAELGAIADWPPSRHWPSAIVVFPVKDAARAKEIIRVLARASDEDATWRETDRDGVLFFSMESAGGLVAFHPTIAKSIKVMIIGLDEASVEAAMRRSKTSTSDLSSSANYRSAAQLVPTPANFFAYIDTALLYSRLDNTLRPILLMGAAFMPGANDNVDLGKIPPPEIITKHLTPIVSSQTYKGDGYLTESVGPVTLNQAGVGLGVVVGFGFAAYQRGPSPLWNVLGAFSSPAPQVATPAPSLSPRPSGTP
jgi:hypothetical protein